MSKGLELLSIAWGLPLSELEVALHENDDDRRGSKMGGRQPENARPFSNGATRRPHQ